MMNETEINGILLVLVIIGFITIVIILSRVVISIFDHYNPIKENEEEKYDE